MRFPGRRRRLVGRRFFEGELEKIPSPKKEKAPSPPVLKKKEGIDSSSEEEGEEDEWPKHLASFQVNAVSLSSRLSISCGTEVKLEADRKASSRRKAGAMLRDSNEDLIARCRVYQQVGVRSNQRVVAFVLCDS